jgi:hypothetical protein
MVIKIMRIQHAILLLTALVLGAPPVMADPVSTLLSFLMSEEASPEKSKRSDEDRISWRNRLSEQQLAVIESMQHHPAIAACISAADQNNPIADFYSIKIARFSAKVKDEMEHTGSMPDIKSLNYKWPGKAMRYCGRRAGTYTSSDHLSLSTYAFKIASILNSSQNQEDMFALGESIASNSVSHDRVIPE